MEHQTVFCYLAGCRLPACVRARDARVAAFMADREWERTERWEDGFPIGDYIVVRLAENREVA